MIYGNRRRHLPLGGISARVEHHTLADFQRWAIRKAYIVVPFEEYNSAIRGTLQQTQTLVTRRPALFRPVT